MKINLNVGFTTPLVIHHVPPPQPPVPINDLSGVNVVTVVDDGFRITNFLKRGFTNMAYTLPDDRKVQVSIAYVDAKGHPAEVDGDVAWTTSDDMIANVGVLQGDSTKAEVIPGANLGQAQITATADADLGAGVTNIITTFDVSVVAGSAVAGVITPGDPIPLEGKAPRTGTGKPASGATPSGTIPRK